MAIQEGVPAVKINKYVNDCAEKTRAVPIFGVSVPTEVCDTPKRPAIAVYRVSFESRVKGRGGHTYWRGTE